MVGKLSVRFVAPENVVCPLVRHRLSRRQAPEQPYAFDRAGIRRLIAAIVEASAGLVPAHEIDLVEVYTANKYFAAIELHATKSAILDYGFVELLADNVALEYLDHATARILRDWFAAGQPDAGPAEDVNSFEVDGVAYHVTGTMMLRDVACKFLDDILPDPPVRERLADRLLWRAADGARPNRHFHSFLGDGPNSTDVLPAFVEEEGDRATLGDQVALAAAFVACHEIAHLAYSIEDQQAWRASPLAKQVGRIFDDLCAIPIEEGQPGTLGHLTSAARRDPDIQERVRSEAVVDIRAIDMMIEHQRRSGRDPGRWATYFANLFALVSMTNSLGIFRCHMVAAIRQRSIDIGHVHVARSEAVMRNLSVLAYLLHRHRELAGGSPGRNLLQKVYPEWLKLERRMVYFHLDLIAGRSDEEWAELIGSALS